MEPAELAEHALVQDDLPEPAQRVWFVAAAAGASVSPFAAETVASEKFAIDGGVAPTFSIRSGRRWGRLGVSLSASASLGTGFAASPALELRLRDRGCFAEFAMGPNARWLSAREEALDALDAVRTDVSGRYFPLLLTGSLEGRLGRALVVAPKVELDAFVAVRSEISLMPVAGVFGTGEWSHAGFSAGAAIGW